MNKKILYLNYLLNQSFFKEEEKRYISSQINKVNIDNIILFLDEHIKNNNNLYRGYQKKLFNLSQNYLNDLKEGNIKLDKEKRDKIEKKLKYIREQEKKENVDIDLLLNEL